MCSAQLYDTIGATYTVTRRTEPRIAARIWAALGDARTVLNVGAGTGSYEPPDRHVLAVEPSALMRYQRLPDAAPCLAGSAAFSKPTGAGPRHTWTRMSVAEYLSGPASGRTPSRGRRSASVMTSPQVGGPNATAISSIWTRQGLALACSSPDPAMS